MVLLKRFMAARHRITAILAAVALLAVVGVYRRLPHVGSQQVSVSFHQKQDGSAAWPMALADVEPASVAEELESPPLSSAIALRRPGNLSTVFTIAAESNTRWEAGTFCRDFVEDTFTVPLNVCASGGQIRCYGAAYSTVMAQCIIENVLIRPAVAYDTLAWGDRDKRTPGSNATQLVSTPDTTPCGSPNPQRLIRVTQRFDPTRVLAFEALASAPARPEDCEAWVEETTFVFTSSCEHVYFRFMAWYSLFKSLLDRGAIGSHKILRLDETHHAYMFADFERRLFPGLYPVQELREKRLCFRKLITSPWMYSSIPFECKQKRMLRQRCHSCSGRNASLSSFALFRKHVLSTCGVDDSLPVSSYRDPKTVVIILRKQYKRHPYDGGKIERILENEDDLVSGIKNHFPGADIQGVHPEDLDICEQIVVVHRADILVGLHGAGLVHLWWLRDSAFILELVPGYERDNPTFRMLAALTGTSYIGHNIDDRTSKYIMKVNVTKVLQTLDSALSSHNSSFQFM
eukprot:Em0019g1153a